MKSPAKRDEQTVQIATVLFMVVLGALALVAATGLVRVAGDGAPLLLLGGLVAFSTWRLVRRR